MVLRWCALRNCYFNVDGRNFSGKSSKVEIEIYENLKSYYLGSVITLIVMRLIFGGTALVMFGPLLSMLSRALQKKE